MATPDLPLLLSKKSRDGIIKFHSECFKSMQTRTQMISRMEEIDRQYQREKDQTSEQKKAKTANAYGDVTKYQNQTVPVVLPAVESAVTYQAGVFLSDTPLFPVVAAPQYIDAAIQMESIIDNQAIRGGWAEQFILFFRDIFKYETGGALEIAWENTKVPSFDTEPTTGKAVPKTETIWSGNIIRRLDPYNTIWDTRVAPVEVPTRGEFAGYSKIMSRIELKKFISSLPGTILPEDITAAFNSTFPATVTSAVDGSYYIPSINVSSFRERNLLSQSTDWMSWAQLTGADKETRINYQNVYQVDFLYGRVLPADFMIKTANAKSPQIWRFTIVNKQVVLHAERMTNAHDMIPILFGQPLRDGLEYQTKSLGENVTPLQEITSALINSVIHARRRAISDRAIYNPQMISEAHVNSDNPISKIPLRAAAYNKDIGQAYHQVPFRDDQSQFIMQQIPMFKQMANEIAGQNPVRQGQFVKGNKTNDQFGAVMSNANGRDQLTSILLESQVFTPIKEMLKINILQYQPTGEVFSRALNQQVEINVVELRRAALQFKVADGLLPSEKIIDQDSWQTALQVIGSSPQIAAEYNLSPMISYMLKIRGANVKEFEKSPQQVAYEQALMQWQQTAMEAMKAGVEFKVPQPVPQNYGYDLSGETQ